MTNLELHLTELEKEIAGRFLDLREGDILRCHGLDSEVVELHKVAQHGTRLVERAEAIVLADTVLLQEVVLEHARDLERDLVVLAERTLADKLHDLRKIVLLLQDLLRLGAQLDEAGFGSLVMRLEHLSVLGVRDVPVDRREVFALRKLLVQSPEDLYDAESRGGDRI